MRQRVAIATALLNRPAMLIADEPTTALDVTIQAQILSEVQALCAETGTAMLWITHDLSVIAGLADRIAVMYAGRIVETGAVAETIERPLHPYTAGLIGSVPSRNRRGVPLKQIPGHDALAEKPAARLRLCAALPACEPALPHDGAFADALRRSARDALPPPLARSEQRRGLSAWAPRSSISWASRSAS